jgi:hypothetical protein
MVTVKLMERLWASKAYGRVVREMLAGRPEASLKLEMELGWAAPAAALMLIRLDELSQQSARLYSTLVRVVLSEQQSDGGWGDLFSTAVCLRALLAGQGQGQAIDGGMAYLSALQKDDGAWPSAPLRRMPADAFVTAFILLQLGEHAAFRAAVNFDAAVDWLEENPEALDAASRPLWQLVRLRCGTCAFQRPMAAALWS